jgi:hypothetical protein
MQVGEAEENERTTVTVQAEQIPVRLSQGEETRCVECRFPQARMENLFNLVADELCRYVQVSSALSKRECCLRSLEHECMAWALVCTERFVVTKRFDLQSSLSVVDLWQAPFHKVGGECHLTVASEQCHGS